MAEGKDCMYYEDNVVLCVSNAYEKKFYMNPDFNGLPDHIKKELKIMCVLFTEEDRKSTRLNSSH